MRRPLDDMAALFAPPEIAAGEKPYAFAVCALPDASDIADISDTGLHARLAPLDQAGTIVLPDWPARVAPPVLLLDKLAAAHARGARLCAIGPGLLVLAATGLLEGRRVAATRDIADKLLRRHPDLNIRSGALFIDAGQILTAAGPAASDLAAQRLAAVSAVAREDDAVQTDDASEDERFGHLLEWLREHPSQPHTPESMATHAAIAAASLQRRFFEATGLTPADWLRQERLALLRALLETPPADKHRD